MQLEVVLPAKELLADLALELAASTVGGDVAAQVPLTGEHPCIMPVPVTSF